MPVGNNALIRPATPLTRGDRERSQLHPQAPWGGSFAMVGKTSPRRMYGPAIMHLVLCFVSQAQEDYLRGYEIAQFMVAHSPNTSTNVK